MTQNTDTSTPLSGAVGGSHTSSPARWVRRTHLLTRFDHSPGIIVIRAEGDAGKTTLVTQWLEHSRAAARIAWVTFTQHDHNPAVAWRKLLLSLRATAPQPFGTVFDDNANRLFGHSVGLRHAG